MPSINSYIAGFSYTPVGLYKRSNAPAVDGNQAAAVQVGKTSISNQVQGNKSVQPAPQIKAANQCSCGNCPSCRGELQRAAQVSNGAVATQEGSQNVTDSATRGAGSEGLTGQIDDTEKTVSDNAISTAGEKKADGTRLTDEEVRELALLKKIDTQVRAHEMAHVAAAGAYSKGGVSFQYRKGPDGRNYAVGGEVQIDTGAEATPEATIKKMQVVRAAALAPADPSPQDRKVAASAMAAISEAKQQLQVEKMEEMATRMKIAEKTGEGLQASHSETGQDAESQSAGGQSVSAEAGARVLSRYINSAQQPSSNSDFSVFI